MCSAGVKLSRVGAEMAERDQRKRRVERVHLLRDQLVLDIGEHGTRISRERAVRIDRCAGSAGGKREKAA